MSTALQPSMSVTPVEPRVTVAYNRGKSLEIGCSYRECQCRASTLKIRENGDVIFENRDRHNHEWHWNSRSLREMVEIMAYHDMQALKNLLGPDLIRKLTDR